jgi:hypothetical protein
MVEKFLFKIIQRKTVDSADLGAVHPAEKTEASRSRFSADPGEQDASS